MKDDRVREQLDRVLASATFRQVDRLKRFLSFIVTEAIAGRGDQLKEYVIGVQVFDPTGRLCGVLTPAAPGRPEHLAFEGDRLTLWVGDTKYARKLNTRGAK